MVDRWYAYKNLDKEVEFNVLRDISDIKNIELEAIAE
jgi:hypothetical protein